MNLPAIPELTYRYWLRKNNREDSREAFAEYYRQSAYQETEEFSFSSLPDWMQEASIEEGYKHRFVD